MAEESAGKDFCVETFFPGRERGRKQRRRSKGTVVEWEMRVLVRGWGGKEAITLSNNNKVR